MLAAIGKLGTLCRITSSAAMAVPPAAACSSASAPRICFMLKAQCSVIGAGPRTAATSAALTGSA